MKINILDEPLLQFKSGTHIDIRQGLKAHGAFDRGQFNVGSRIGVGVVGIQATVDGVRNWLEQAKNGLKSKEEKLKELRPDFPGMREDIFGTRLNIPESAVRTLSKNELALAISSQNPLVAVVDLFLNHARDLAGKGGLQVIIVAPPVEVFMLANGKPLGPDPELDESSDLANNSYRLNFHDLFKARALDLAVPCQIIRPDTYGGGSTKKAGAKSLSLQDPATRAWNFHVALYYKAGGVPWRLVRQSSELDTCYVGISFYKSLGGEKLLTSVAQVFDERGEGLIVQGGNARVDKEDRTSHLSSDDAHKILVAGLASYRREHKNLPARVVLHKTSYFDEAEIAGFQQAAKDERVEVLDLVSVRRSNIKLLRAANPSVLRGTVLSLDSSSGLVYLKGTVPFFRTYPGMYVPRALEFKCEDSQTRPLEIAKELLSLSKLNFNNTQFDTGDPITIRAARSVGDILKHVAEGQTVQSRFRYFT